MEWLLLLQALLPLIEFLLKLFVKQRSGVLRKRLSEALARCNEATDGLSLAERRRHKDILARLDKANARAKKLGIV